MSIANALKGFAATAVVLAIPTFALCGLLNSSPTTASDNVGLHIVAPVSTASLSHTVAATQASDVDARLWSFTWGSGLPPCPCSPLPQPSYPCAVPLNCPK